MQTQLNRFAFAVPQVLTCFLLPQLEYQPISPGKIDAHVSHFAFTNLFGVRRNSKRPSQGRTTNVVAWKKNRKVTMTWPDESSFDLFFFRKFYFIFIFIVFSSAPKKRNANEKNMHTKNHFLLAAFIDLRRGSIQWICP